MVCFIVNVKNLFFMIKLHNYHISAILMVICYLSSSVNFGLLIAKVFAPGKNLRTFGSGNVGATNVWRMMGIGWAIVVWILDGLKTVVPMLVAKLYFNCSSSIINAMAICGILAHIFPIWNGFKGGKGFATFSLSSIVINPIYFACICSMFAFARICKAPVFICSLAGAAAAVAWSVINDPSNLTYFALCFVILIFSHRSNIKQFINS